MRDDDRPYAISYGTNGGLRNVMERRDLVSDSSSRDSKKKEMAALLSIPQQCRKLVGVSLGTAFREVVQLQTVPTPRAGPRELLVRTRYAGINASDINWTAGRYIPGLQPPFDTGFEGLGQVVEAGKDCKGFKVGDPVLYMHSGSFSEYLTLPFRRATLLPRDDPAYLSLLVSGCTASIALEKVGEVKKGDKVLVTAAAGGTGQFAVQLAKLAGCHVIGTCSTDKKAEFLRGLGCDRPVNYKKENLKSVLKEEYPRGVDVVYEGVGGDIFNTCVKNLATKGRLVTIGFIESYQSSNFSARPTLPLHRILISKSASIRGFFLNDYVTDMPSHISRLCQLYEQGQLKAEVDMGEKVSGGPFRGLEAVYDAVEYIYTGLSRGKVVVEVSPPAAADSVTRARL